MQLLAEIFITVVIIIHLYIVWLEMFAWTTRAPRVFRSIKPELFPPTKVLAANQGLYNAFLIGGLAWSIYIEDPVWKVHVAVFFLTCVAVAGIYGAITASRRIFFVQTIPAIIPLLILILHCYMKVI